ncbi:MAG TPA: GNAT family N-acetyltransferase [Acidimicrobiales bacterium]
MEGARPATAEDLPDLERLAGEAVAELTAERGGAMWARTLGRRAPYVDDLAHALADHDTLVLCGTVDGAVVGYAVTHLDDIADGGRLAVIDDLYTEPQARTVGVGEALLAAIVAWATERGAVGLDAVVLPGARETKNFFETFGLRARALVVHRDLP